MTAIKLDVVFNENHSFICDSGIIHIVTAPQTKFAKVMFLQVSVFPQEGVYPSMHWAGGVSQRALDRGCVSQHALGGEGCISHHALGRGCLPRGVSA